MPRWRRRAQRPLAARPCPCGGQHRSAGPDHEVAQRGASADHPRRRAYLPYGHLISHVDQLEQLAAPGKTSYACQATRPPALRVCEAFLPAARLVVPVPLAASRLLAWPARG